MDEKDKLVKLAIDNYKGKSVSDKFSKEATNNVLRNALIELNDGKDKISRRSLQRGASNGLFAIIEEILDVTIREGLQGNEFFNQFVEYRNIGLGDKNEFVKVDNTLFVVADIARGTGGLQRQRVGERKRITIPVTPKGVRIYDELDRVLAGRVDFNDFINRVGESFTRKILDDVYATFSSLNEAKLGSTMYRTGSFDEDVLIDLIEHVEARTGEKATIVSTLKGLRKLLSSDMFEKWGGESVFEDIYNMGFAGRFGGTPTMRIEQRYKVGTETFIFPDNEIFVIAGDDKFIKHITEGESLVDYKQGLDNIADFTQEYMFIDINGTGLLLNNSGIGKYTIS